MAIAVCIPKWDNRHAQRGPKGPIGGGRPPWALWGPQGLQEGTGSPPGGSPGQGEHGEVVPDVYGKSHFSTSKNAQGLVNSTLKMSLSGFRFAYLPVPGEEDLMC